MRSSCDFGSRVKSLRRKLGLSVRDLAKKIGKSPGYVSQIECSGEIPSPELTCRLAAELNVTPDILLRKAKSDQIKREIVRIEAAQERALILFRKSK